MTRPRSAPPSSTSEMRRPTASLWPSRARSTRVEVSMVSRSSGLDRDDLGDARDPLLQDPLDPLLEGHRRDGAAVASAEELDGHDTALDVLEADVTPVHLDGGADQFEGFPNLVLNRGRRAHAGILPGALW